MDELAVVRAELACTRLVNDYAARLDGGTPDTLWELFTEDGIWEMPGRHTFHGRADLRARAPGVLGGDARITMHLCTNVVVDVTGADAARGHCYFANHRADFDSADAVQRPSGRTEPRYIGEYFDVFAKVNDRWLIAHRVVRVNFAAPRRGRAADQ
jgi:hypothetical protein